MRASTCLLYALTLTLTAAAPTSSELPPAAAAVADSGGSGGWWSALWTWLRPWTWSWGGAGQEPPGPPTPPRASVRCDEQTCTNTVCAGAVCTTRTCGIYDTDMHGLCRDYPIATTLTLTAGSATEKTAGGAGAVAKPLQLEAALSSAASTARPSKPAAAA